MLVACIWSWVILSSCFFFLSKYEYSFSRGLYVVLNNNVTTIQVSDRRYTSLAYGRHRFFFISWLNMFFGSKFSWIRDATHRTVAWHTLTLHSRAICQTHSYQFIEKSTQSPTELTKSNRMREGKNDTKGGMAKTKKLNGIALNEQQPQHQYVQMPVFGTIYAANANAEKFQMLRCKPNRWIEIFEWIIECTSKGFCAVKNRH